MEKAKKIKEKNTSKFHNVLIIFLFDYTMYNIYLCEQISSLFPVHIITILNICSKQFVYKNIKV